jgi:cytochrome P450
VQTLRGDLTHRVKELHDEYGEVVRIAPNELSFTSLEAWQSIYGVQPGRRENLRDEAENTAVGTEHQSLFTASSQKHAFLRRLLAPTFTGKAIRDQEVVLQNYVDQLIRVFRDLCEDGRSPLVDVNDFYTVCYVNLFDKPCPLFLP